MKVLILSEMLIGKRNDYGPCYVIEGEINEEDKNIFEAVHGIDLSEVEDEQYEKISKAIDEFINFVYESVDNRLTLRKNFTCVICSDQQKTQQQLGPYDRVYHVRY